MSKSKLKKLESMSIERLSLPSLQVGDTVTLMGIDIAISKTGVILLKGTLCDDKKVLIDAESLSLIGYGVIDLSSRMKRKDVRYINGKKVISRYRRVSKWGQSFELELISFLHEHDLNLSNLTAVVWESIKMGYKNVPTDQTSVAIRYLLSSFLHKEKVFNVPLLPSQWHSSLLERGKDKKGSRKKRDVKKEVRVNLKHRLSSSPSFADLFSQPSKVYTDDVSDAIGMTVGYLLRNNYLI